MFSSPGIYRLVLFATNYTDLAYADLQVAATPTPAASNTVTSTKIIYQQVYTPVYTPVYIPVQGSTPTGNTGREPGDN